MSNIMSIVVTGFFITSFAYLLCFCCCIMQFFIRRNKERRRRTQAILTGVHTPEGPNVMQRNDTLKKKFLRQFKERVKHLSSVGVSNVSTGDPDISCPICFEEYSGDPSQIFIGYVNICGHYFHFECIWKWLENNPNCPLCRESVLLKEEDIRGVVLSAVSDLQKQQQPLQRDTRETSAGLEMGVVEQTSGNGSTSREPTEHTPVVATHTRHTSAEIILSVQNELVKSSNPKVVVQNRRSSGERSKKAQSLGHLSVASTPDVDPIEEGTIASGVAFPGCGDSQARKQEHTHQHGKMEEDDEGETSASSAESSSESSSEYSEEEEEQEQDEEEEEQEEEEQEEEEQEEEEYEEHAL